MTLEQEQARRLKKLDLVRASEAAKHALEHNNFSTAETKFKEALKIAEEIGEGVAEAEAGLLETAYHAGRAAEEAGHLQEALAHYHDVLEYDPEHREAQVRLTAVTRKLRSQRVTIGGIAAVVTLIVLALVSRVIPWPEPVCNNDNVGAVLCKPTLTPTVTPTPTPYLIIEVLNKENEPIPVREMGVLEDTQPVSICTTDCRRGTSEFSDTATNIGAYISLYTEELQIFVDEDSLPAVASASTAAPDAAQHSVFWPRWNTGEHTARFVVATMTPTPTPTATPTPTPTPTSTPTPTPTPQPLTVIGSAPNPNVLDSPGGKLLFYLQRGTCVYVCSETDEYYQVAYDYCHLTMPLGWVPKKHVAAPHSEPCATVGMTPTPTPGQ